MDNSTELECPKIHFIPSSTQQKDDTLDIITKNEGKINCIMLDENFYEGKDTKEYFDVSESCTIFNADSESDPLQIFNNEEKIIVDVHRNITEENGDFHKVCLVDEMTRNLKEPSSECEPLINGVSIFEVNKKDVPVLDKKALKIAELSSVDTVSIYNNENKYTSDAEVRQCLSLPGKKKTDFHFGENLQQSGLKMYVCNCHATKDLEIKNPQKVIALLTDMNNYNNTGITKTEHFKCKSCNKMYSVVGGLRYHINKQFTKVCSLKKRKNVRKKEKKIYVCQLCRKVFEKKLLLTQHNNRVHKEVKKYICGVCDKKFVKLNGLNKHINGVHKGIKKFKCGECPRTYQSMFFLKEHINVTHNGLISYMCDKCGKMFPHQSGLNRHEDSKHGVVNMEYKCEECSNTFSTLYGLKRHIKRVHEGIKKNAKCDECDKIFSSFSHRKLHIETVHRKIKKYKCPSCDKTFTQKSNMNIHISGVHYGIKKYECGLCLRTFLHCRDLKIHVNAAHNQVKDYVCSECEKRYSLKTTLKKHIESVHILI